MFNGALNDMNKPSYYKYTHFKIGTFVYLVMAAAPFMAIFEQAYIDYYAITVTATVLDRRESREPQPINLQFHARDGHDYTIHVNRKNLQTGDKVEIQYWTGRPSEGFLRNGYITPTFVFTLSIALFFRSRNFYRHNS